MCRTSQAMQVILLLLASNALLAHVRGQKSDEELEQAFYAGRWEYFNEQEATGLSYCPRAAPEMPLPPHWRGGYTKADFFPADGVRFLSLSHSLHRLSKFFGGPVNISFIGDSLSNQKYYAALCSAEFEELPVNPSHVHSRWLTENPCGCRAEDNTDTHYSAHNYPRCLPIDSPDNWEVWLDNPRIIVISGGAWFTRYWLGCMNFDQLEKSYAKMLKALIPLFKKYMQRGITVVWFGLPYSLSDNPDYGHVRFKDRNFVARTLLSEHGVLVVDPYDLVKGRVGHDGAIKCDDLHFCGFGPFSVPVFEFRLIMHFLAHKLAR